ncbi:MAG: hypothetical protein K9G67_08165 [Bacteroidales bacterium]|nr:hypothetical protein [Bacteroidales bacterium]MCF8345558.1 hypothetical protein [Bacteroidales bacterium]MCF8350725.1 hypothetical protein [Bacteroidales bacterium]MCF8376312.1 hypothetical protein [Bacteroidales bacterium]MCF8401005.1 hypothetical protein [Bacteroidales bacterium]
MEQKKLILYKLERFLKKYYFSRLIRGLISGLSIVVLVFLLFVLAEYFSYFNPGFRQALFIGFVAIAFLVTLLLIIRPILQIIKVGRGLTHVDAAGIIGRYFPEVKDKLLNTLQLIGLSGTDVADYRLLEASIDQKTESIKLVPFQKAVRLGENRKYLRYFVPLSFILLLLLILSPQLVTEPTERIVNYKNVYEKPRPFSIRIKNNDLSVLQREDFHLEVEITGDERPAQLFIEYENNVQRLNKESADDFKYTFRQPVKDIRFKIKSSEVSTGHYTLKVHPKPALLGYEITIDYPDHTGLETELVKDNGEMVIPEGSQVDWKIFTKNTESVKFFYNGELEQLKAENTNVYQVGKKVLKDSDYSISLQNEYASSADSVYFSIHAVKDAYPDIEVRRFRDSAQENMLFFSGIVKDDYGISGLSFRYKIFEDQGKKKETRNEIIPIDTESTGERQQFLYQVNLDDLPLKEGNIMEYHFMVCDNDAVNGYKCSGSRKFEFKVKTREEIEAELKQEDKEIQRKLNENLKDIQKINEKIEKFVKEKKSGKQFNWNDKKRIEDLMKEQLRVKKDIEENLDRLNRKNEKESESFEYSEDILEKQRQLEELFEKVLDVETKKLMDELQKLLEEYNEDKMQDLMEKMKMSNDELEEELDRNLELLKQLEFEKTLNQTLDKLDSLRKDQEELKKETDQNTGEKESLMEEQEKLQEEFKEIEKDLKELKNKAEELENKPEFPETQSEQEGVKKEMEESKQNMGKGKLEKSAQSQQKAAEGMQKLKDMLFQMQSQSSQQQGEDLNKLRGLLENIVKVSFEQESVMDIMKSIKENDPAYVKTLNVQKDIMEEVDLIRDSLNALARRNFMIAPVINEEIKKIYDYAEKALNEFESTNFRDNNMQRGIADQQFMLTAINNLALLLAEAINQMESNMAMQNSMSGESQCSQPGGGKKKSAKSLRQMQEQLNQQIDQLKKQMKGKSGKTGKGKGKMSEQFARMAAEQEMIRRQVQGYMEELKKMGVDEEGLNDVMKEMEKSEQDIINKIIDQQTINRQQEILTRLLKSEEAELQREKSEERESREAKDQKFSNPERKIEYKGKKTQETEVLRRVDPRMQEFYRQKVKNYLYEYLFENED